MPHYVIKKGRHHGVRHRKTEAQKEHFVAHNARKRCISKNMMEFTDRFQRDPVYIDSQLKKKAGPRRSASQCINWHMKTTLTNYFMKNMRDINNVGISH